MVISISLVLVLGAATYVLIRYAGMRAWHAVVAALFGFYLAETAFAPEITSVVRSIFGVLMGFDAR